MGSGTGLGSCGKFRPPPHRVSISGPPRPVASRDTDCAIPALWSCSLREKNDLEDLGVDGKIMLKLVFKEWDAVMD